jgi:hypothetical protein
MNTWTDFFDCIYLINLAKREDRLLQAAEELEKFNIPYKRICAIEKENGAEGLRDTMLLIFNEAIEQDYKNILIFEDDIEFCEEDVNDVMSKAIAQLPSSYRLLFLGCQPTAGFSHFHSPNLLPAIKCFATHAVAYSRKCMEEIVALRMEFPIDNWMVTEIETRGECFVTYPMLASQRPGVSDIGKTFINWKPFMDARYTQKIHELKSRL